MMALFWFAFRMAYRHRRRVTPLTSTVARSLQVWFTSRMQSTKSKRETIYDKAERICRDMNRVTTLQARGTDFWKGNVVGDHGTYRVVAVSPEWQETNELDGRIACGCKAGRRGKPCSHGIVGEEMRKRGAE